MKTLTFVDADTNDGGCTIPLREHCSGELMRSRSPIPCQLLNMLHSITLYFHEFGQNLAIGSGDIKKCHNDTCANATGSR